MFEKFWMNGLNAYPPIAILFRRKIVNRQPESMDAFRTNPIQSAIDQMGAMGLLIDTFIADGNIQRVKTIGDKNSQRSGWYIAYENRLDSGCTVITGCFGNWKKSSESQAFQFDATLSNQERAVVRSQLEHHRRIAAGTRRNRNRQAAENANRIWSQLSPNGQSGYLVRKKIHGFGCRYANGKIAIPLYKDECLTGLQYIFEDGTKRFLKGTEKRGASFTIEGNNSSGMVVLCEGYATGCSIHMATGFTTIVGIDANNLLVVAGQVAATGQLIMVAADNDHISETNKGLDIAAKIQKAHGAMVRWPQFEPGSPVSDFNDLHVMHGLEAVRKVLLGPPLDWPAGRH